MHNLNANFLYLIFFFYKTWDGTDLSACKMDKEGEWDDASVLSLRGWGCLSTRNSIAFQSQRSREAYLVEYSSTLIMTQYMIYMHYRGNILEFRHPQVTGARTTPMR